MSDSWAVRFPLASILAALPLRANAGIEICRTETEAWLKGTGDFDPIRSAVQKIPDAICFSIGTDGRATRLGQIIPEAELPQGPWKPLARTFGLSPGMAGLPGRNIKQVNIRLVRAEIEEKAGAMMTSVEQWTEYSSTAPQIRLKHLRFAMSADGRVLVIGAPLPPIPGRYLVNREGLLIPSGFQWQPFVEPRILREAMGLTQDDLALFLVEGEYEVIKEEWLVRASRSAARASGGKFAVFAGKP